MAPTPPSTEGAGTRDPGPPLSNATDTDPIPSMGSVSFLRCTLPARIFFWLLDSSPLPLPLIGLAFSSASLVTPGPDETQNCTVKYST